MTDPVWSVILLIVIGLLFAAYIIYYILREAYLEVQNGNETTEGSCSESSQELR
jgi:uncharacterized membrane protein YraQ (UPF0718 family)